MHSHQFIQQKDKSLEIFHDSINKKDMITTINPRHKIAEYGRCIKSITFIKAAVGSTSVFELHTLNRHFNIDSRFY